MKDTIFRLVTEITGWPLEWTETHAESQVTEAAFTIASQPFSLWVEFAPGKAIKLAFYNEQDDDIQDVEVEALARLRAGLAAAGFAL